MGNKCLESVFKVEILGVIFDDKLVFDEHINYISKNTQSKNRFIVTFETFSSRKKH
jgi:hypothetical protein